MIFVGTLERTVSHYSSMITFYNEYYLELDPQAQVLHQIIKMKLNRLH